MTGDDALVLCFLHGLVHLEFRSRLNLREEYG